MNFLKKSLVSLFSIALFAGSLPSLAADFVNHTDSKPQTLNLPAKGKIQIINLWGAYCKPCRKEMPEMSRWYQQKGKKQGIQMVGIALDNQENVSNFLKTTPVHYDIWRFEGKSSRKLMKSFGNDKGVLPYTLVRSSCAQQAIYGEVDGKKLDQAVKDVSAKCR